MDLARFTASSPEAVGIDPDKLEQLFARAQRDVARAERDVARAQRDRDEGGLPSCQVAVARRGLIAGMRTFGNAIQGGQERPATAHTLYHYFSSTKAIVGAAMWLLLEDGVLRLDEKVAAVIPEFGTHGKDVIDIETLMLHAGGFPLAPFRQDWWSDRGKLLEAFSQWKLNWPVDSRFEYHATSAHWVMSEIIERRAGMPWKQFIQQRLLGPMGLDELYIGCPPEQQHRIADVLYVGEHPEPPGGWGEVTPQLITNFNQAHVRASGVPGGGAIASAASMALFYQPLVNGGVTHDGTRIMKPETIEIGTRVRAKPQHIMEELKLIDPNLVVNTNRALAVVVAGGDGYAAHRGFGRTCSPRAFGHGGAGGQIAWGDPETGISVSYATNGFAPPIPQARRGVAISSLAAVCARA